MTTATALNAAEEDGVAQYSLLKIMTTWAIAAAPMPFLVFWVAPALAASTGTLLILMIWYAGIASMIWQFIVSVGVLYLEMETFTWSALKKRIWLNKPRNPKNGKKSYKLFWWLVPAAAFVMVIEMTVVGEFLQTIMTKVFPFTANLAESDLEGLFIPELAGAWWLIGVALLNNIFNYFLGEELLFRGVLLPKMRGVFGKWDWVANAFLFGIFHLDKPTNMLRVAVSTLGYNWVSVRFRSIWFAIILHGVEGFIVLGGVYMVASGAFL